MKFQRKDYIDVIRKYNDDSMQYCLDVLENKIIAGELIQLACLRHLNDLKKIGNEDFPYTYSVGKAEGIVNFAELIPDVNDSAGSTFKLARYERFILQQLDAWRDIRTGGARFKTIYLSMARSNGKTQLASIIALRDFLLGQPDNSRQIVVASNNHDQVTQLYRYIRKAWHALAETKWFKPIADEVDDNSLEFRIDSQNTRLMQLSAEGKGADSVHATTAIFDEYHLQQSTDFIDSITSGSISNPSSRLIYISTAGEHANYPMGQDYKSYSDLLRRGKLTDSILIICYEQDNDEEAFPEKLPEGKEIWQKSNPLMEVKSRHDSLIIGNTTERDKQVAAGHLPKFLVKNMNRWQNAQANAYVDLEDINKAIIDKDDFDLHDREVYLGYDASLSSDDTSLVALIPYLDEDNKQRFHIWQHTFVPTRVAGGIEAKEKQDGINYRRAEEQGYATITTDRFGGINQGQVYQYMLETVEKYNWHVLGFGYDSWGTGLFIKTLQELKDDWLLFPIRQGAKSLSEPTKFIMDGFATRAFTMFNDPVMQAGLSNAVLTDKNNQLLIDKNKGSQKIDMVDALIDAAYQGMLHFTNFTNEEAKQDKHNPFAGWTNDDIRKHFGKKFTF